MVRQDLSEQDLQAKEKRVTDARNSMCIIWGEFERDK